MHCAAKARPRLATAFLPSHSRLLRVGARCLARWPDALESLEGLAAGQVDLRGHRPASQTLLFRVELSASALTHSAPLPGSFVASVAAVVGLLVDEADWRPSCAQGFSASRASREVRSVALNESAVARKSRSFGFRINSKTALFGSADRCASPGEVLAAPLELFNLARAFFRVTFILLALLRSRVRRALRDPDPILGWVSFSCHHVGGMFYRRSTVAFSGLVAAGAHASGHLYATQTQASPLHPAPAARWRGRWNGDQGPRLWLVATFAVLRHTHSLQVVPASDIRHRLRAIPAGAIHHSLRAMLASPSAIRH